MRLFSFLALISLVLLVASAHANVILTSVERKIDLDSQFARIYETYKVQNKGSTTVRSVTVCHIVHEKTSIGHVVAKVAAKRELEIVPSLESKDLPSDVVCHDVRLEKPLSPSASTIFNLFAVFTEAQTPYPATIEQNQLPLMIYLNNVYITSPYEVLSQKTEVALPSSRVKSYTENSPSTRFDKTIKYGPYENVKPFTSKQMRLHYETAKQFKKVTSLVKEIEVSHWGNVYVEEKYELENYGPKHKGAFSRLQYVKMGSMIQNSFRDMVARLPPKARSIYYVDRIGNISTSNVRPSAGYTFLDFSTRYPLMGGWKVDFKLGYSVPLETVISRSPSGRRHLSFEIGSPLLDVFVEDVEVRIVLPEGAYNINTSLPLVMAESRDVKFSYLDISGRPVVVLNRRLMVPEQEMTRLEVSYDFNSLSMMREPLMLVLSIFAMLVAFAVYNRLDLRISRGTAWIERQQAEQLVALADRIQSKAEESLKHTESLLKATASCNTAEAASKVKLSSEKEAKSLEAQIQSLLEEITAADQRRTFAKQVREGVSNALEAAVRVQRTLQERADLARKNTPRLEMEKRFAASRSNTEEAVRVARETIEDAVSSL